MEDQHFQSFKNSQFYDNQNEYENLSNEIENKKNQNSNQGNKVHLKQELDAVPETSIESEQTYHTNPKDSNNDPKKQNYNQLQQQIKKIKFSPNAIREHALNQQLQQQFSGYKPNDLKSSYAQSDKEYQDQHLKTSFTDIDNQEQQHRSTSPPRGGSFKEINQNKTYFQTQPQENSDLVYIINIEKEKNKKLEERIFQQEKLLNQMREFHNQICKAFGATQEELIKIKAEKSSTETNQEKESLEIIEKFQQFESQQNKLQAANKDLQQQLKEKNNVIAQLQDEQRLATRNASEQQKSLEEFQQHLIEKEKENRELKKLLSQQGDESLNIFDANMRITTLEDDNTKLQMAIESQQNNVHSMLNQRDQLINQINMLNNQLIQIKQAHQLQYEQTLMETKKKYEEKINQIQTETQYKYHIKKKNYEETIKKMQKEKANIINQQIQMQYLTQNKTNLYQNQTESLTDRDRNQNGNTQLQQQYDQLLNILFLINQELQTTNSQDLLNKIREIKKFINCIIDMVESFHPGDHFQGKPNLKQSWRWLKKVMEEYMNLKKMGPGAQLQNYQMYQSSIEASQKTSMQDLEIVKKVIEFLKVDNINNVIPRLAVVLSDYEVSNRLLIKLKKLYGQDKIVSLSEMERYISQIEQLNFAARENLNKEQFY